MTLSPRIRGACERETSRRVARVAERYRLSEHHELVSDFLDEYPITDYLESAKLYFLFGVMVDAGFALSPDNWNTVERHIETLGKFGSFRRASERAFAARFLADFGDQARPAIPATSSSVTGRGSARAGLGASRWQSSRAIARNTKGPCARSTPGTTGKTTSAATSTTSAGTRARRSRNSVSYEPRLSDCMMGDCPATHLQPTHNQGARNSIGKTTPMDSASIRDASWRIVVGLGFPRNDSLPLLDRLSVTRSRDEVVNRVLAMLAVAAAAYGFDRKKALTWLERRRRGWTP